MTFHLRVAQICTLLVGTVSLGGCSNHQRDEARKRITPEYSSSGKLELLKYDSKSNGHVDVWSHMDGARVVRIEIDRDGDGKADRWEAYGPDQTLLRADEDDDGDGRIDKWETYDGARLSSVAFDTLHRGVPDHKLTYTAAGVATMELDPDGDGHLLPEAMAAAATAQPATRAAQR